MNVFYALFEYGTYSKSESYEIIQNEDGTYPLFEMDKDKFLIAYDIIDIAGNIEDKTQASISKYLQGAWFQVDDEQNVTAIKSKPCKDVYPQGTVEETFYN